jgi:hypothetical protein
MPPLTRFRALPLLALFELARTSKAHLDRNLSVSDRRRLGDIMRHSKGDRRRLSDRDRRDLGRIARDLDLAGLARDLAPAAARVRRRR